MDYKFVNKFKKKNKIAEKKGKNRFLNFLLIMIVISLGIAIVLKIDKNNKKVIYNYLYDHNINFTYFKNLFKNVLPYNSDPNVQQVFNETLKYTSINSYKDGCVLTVDNNYLIPSLESGVVVFMGEKDGYGNTLIIQQVNGIDVWYTNVESISVNVYDYVEKGEGVGITNDDKLYMFFAKDGKFIDYKTYIK